MTYDISFVCLLGIGTVFIGLVCIVLLCSIQSKICKLLEKDDSSAPAEIRQTQVQSQAQPSAAVTEIPNRKKIIAAVSVAIAEELGTDVSAIRIKSFKKI